MTGIKQSIPEGKEASEQALAEAIANMDAVDAGSVAGRIDAAISSRSSHSWDPDGVIPAAGTLARQSDVGGGPTYDYHLNLRHQQPSKLSTYGSAGGTFGTDGWSTSSGTAEEYQRVIADTAMRIPSDTKLTFRARYASRRNDGWNDDHWLGLLKNNNITDAGYPGTRFGFDVGNNQVYVDGSTQTISYPDTKKYHEYEVVMDNSNNEFRFYIDGSEQSGDSPVATITDSYSVVSGTRVNVGAAYEGRGYYDKMIVSDMWVKHG